MRQICIVKTTDTVKALSYALHMYLTFCPQNDVPDLSHITINQISRYQSQITENRPYQSGKRKKVWKNVLIPSMSSSKISANPKRKNDLCRFLSSGQSASQAENNKRR